MATRKRKAPTASEALAANLGKQLRVKLGTAADVFSLLHVAARSLEQEVFYVLPLNARNELIGGALEVARGTAHEVAVHPRDVFREAIRMNAVGIAVAHNHPSGDPTPSTDDITLTHRLRAVGDLVGIPVIDHVVIGDASYRSISEWLGSEW